LSFTGRNPAACSDAGYGKSESCEARGRAGDLRLKFEMSEGPILLAECHVAGLTESSRKGGLPTLL
jgi:hypothetical protein